MIASTEPTIQPLLEERVNDINDHGSKNEALFSDWILMLANGNICMVTVNSGFRNKDFRSSEGLSVIDPEVYQQLEAKLQTIRVAYLWTRLALSMLLFLFGALPLTIIIRISLKPVEGEDFGMAFFLGAAGSSLLAFGIFYFLNNKYVFPTVDAGLMRLVDSYEAQFREAFGVEVSHKKSTTQIRWWNDNSGICLRRPRQEAVVEEGDAVVMRGNEECELDNEMSRVPPIFLCLAFPGNVYVTETDYDPLIKVDVKAWTLLQDTNKERITLPRIVRLIFGIYYFAFLIFLVTFSPFFASLQTAIVYAVLIIVACIMLYVLEKRNLRVYREVTREVSEALQDDENTAGLKVEFHDSKLPGRNEVSSRRYQFVRTAGAAEPSKEIV